MGKISFEKLIDLDRRLAAESANLSSDADANPLRNYGRRCCTCACVRCFGLKGPGGAYARNARVDGETVSAIIGLLVCVCVWLLGSVVRKGVCNPLHTFTHFGNSHSAHMVPNMMTYMSLAHTPTQIILPHLTRVSSADVCLRQNTTHIIVIGAHAHRNRNRFVCVCGM